MGFRKLTLNLFFILLFSCGSLSNKGRGPSNIFYEDDRESFEREEFPQWGSLHLKPMRTKPWGTAFLISQCHIGTAYHVVIPTDQQMTGREIAYFDNPLRAEPIKALPVAWGKPWSATKEGLDAEDWVILRLTQCFDKNEVTPLTLSDRAVNSLSREELTQGGFPQDRTIDRVTFDPQCKFGPHLFEKTSLGHTCASRPGSSGSPIMLKSNPEEVVGIVVATRGQFEEVIVGYSHWIANKATSVLPMKKALDEILYPTPPIGPQ